MSVFLERWMRAHLEVVALREQLAHLERMWLDAERDADYWFLRSRYSAAEVERMQRAAIVDAAWDNPDYPLPIHERTGA